MAEKVLVIDDEPLVSEMLKKVMDGDGFESDIAGSGEEALKMFAVQDYSLLLVDINMPGIDGFELIRRIRKSDKKVPIIVVSDRKEDVDTVYGLDVGADEYITKPFNPVTLGARAKALIRRSKGEYASDESMLKAGPFEYNVSTLKLFKNGEQIALSGTENVMMKIFMDNRNHIFSKDMLRELVWDDVNVEDNVISVYINRLRNKIEDNPNKPVYIQNIRKVGYKFSVNE